MSQPLADSIISTLNNLAGQALTAKQPDQAIPLLITVLKSDPHNYPALSNLGTAYKLQGDYRRARRYYHKAEKHNPTNPEILYNLGQIYLKTGQFKPALKYLKRCMRSGSSFTGLHFNAAVCYEELGQPVKAVSIYRQMLDKNPNDLPALSNLVRLSQYLWDWPTVERYAPQLDQQNSQLLAQNQPLFEKPYANLLRTEDKQNNLRVAASASLHLKRSLTMEFDHTHHDRRHRILNLGYLSPDFGDHVMAYHTYPLFQLHNRHHVAVHTYAYGPTNQSPYRTIIQQHSDIWRDLHGESATTIAQSIYADQIDILVDLGGHTGNSRFEIMAMRPAPIQAHYLGFPGSTGANFIDYLFTDQSLTPPDQQSFFSEQLIYLPDCYQINPVEKIRPHRFTKAQCGLPAHSFVFCSFNQSRKITPVILKIWIKLLQAVPNSVLWLVESNPLATNNIRTFASNHGIDPNRLMFAPFTEIDQHLNRLALADLALDPLLYNGGATTSNALLAGVPVITKSGDRYASRMSTSMLQAIGLPECITHTLDEYYQLALTLATQPEKLHALRTKLRRRRLTSPLFQPKKFVRHLETAYQIMWSRYQQHLPPQSFFVKNPV